MSKFAPVASLKRALQSLVGRRCIGVIAGWGSILAIDFEPARRLRVPRITPHLPPRMRTHEGELSLFVEFASWSLWSRGALLISSIADLRSNAGQRRVRRIEQRRLQSVVVDADTRGASLRFENGLRMDLLPVVPKHDRDGTDYTVFLPRTSVSVGRGGRISVELHERSKRTRRE